MDIDVNNLSEVINDKIDRDMSNTTLNIDYVIDHKMPTDDDSRWYRVYKSGWCEQGGLMPTLNANNVWTSFQSITFLKQFKDNKYRILTGETSLTNGASGIGTSFRNKTQSGFEYMDFNSNDNGERSYVCYGKLADGEY